MIAYERFARTVLATLAAGVVLWLAPVRMTRAAEQAAQEELESIIVTAQRRAERLQDVPITITNLSGDSLQQANVTSLSDVQLVTPGFRLDNHGNIFQPTIRGISTSITCVVCGSSVGIYVDNFYVPHPVSTNFSLSNIENIQVLKGPQGTLFGRNTVGGAIQVNTSKPSANTNALLDVSYGSYNAQRYQLYATTGLTDRIAVDVGAWLRKGDGWVTNIYDGDDKYGRYQNSLVRAGLKADVTDSLSLLLRYEHANSNDPTGSLSVPYVSNGQVLAYGAHLPGAVVATGPREVSNDELAVVKSDSDTYQLSATWDLDFGTVASYSQYRRDNTPTWLTSIDFVNVDVYRINIPDFQRTVTQEFLVTSKPGSRLQWTAGAFYYDSNEKYDGIAASLFGSPLTFLSTTNSDDRSIAVYGDATYEVLDKLFLTAGVRYSHDDQRDAYWVLPKTGRTSLPVLPSSRVTPRAVIRYALNDESNVYLSFTRGYKAAIYNTGGYSAVPILPEDMSAFEVGYKYATRKFSANISSFYYDYKNQQLTSEEVINGAISTVITNAASSHIYGLDVDARYELPVGFAVNAGAEFLHARFRSFPNAPGFTVTPNFQLPSVSVDAAGYHMSRSPDFTANLGASYTTDLAKGRFVLSGNFYYTSKFYFDFAEQLSQGAYNTLAVRAEWTNPSDRLVLAIAGSNVTNSKYYNSTTQSVFGAGVIWGAPATIEGSIRLKLH